LSDNAGSADDLRSYLAYAREKGGNNYLGVTREISPRWQTAAVVQGLARKMRSPVIRFDSVAGCEMPMVTNVCSSFDRVAKSVGVTADVLTARLVAAMDSGVPPVPVTAEQAPAREKRYKRGEFSLRQLPELFYTDTQTDPYITSSLVIARDPESGAHNLSFHRLMISGDNIATIYMTPGGHLDQIWKRNCFAGRPTPVAAVIGTHPLWCYASLVSGPLEHDDYSVVGAVLGSGIELTAGLVDPDLMLPARAELILEGLIDPVETKSEGPFGEFLGYVAERDIRPVVTFLSLTTRIEPIYQDDRAHHDVKHWFARQTAQRLFPK